MSDTKFSEEYLQTNEGQFWRGRMNRIAMSLTNKSKGEPSAAVMNHSMMATNFHQNSWLSMKNATKHRVFITRLSGCRLDVRQ